MATQQRTREIERIHGIIAKIDAALALPDIFSREPAKAGQLSKARSAAAEALRRAEDEWLQASASRAEARRAIGSFSLRCVYSPGASPVAHRR